MRSKPWDRNKKQNIISYTINKMAKNWIAGAIKHPGALHRELGVKEGHKIPASKLRAAASKGGVEGKRARLAETLKGFHHKKTHEEKHMKHEKHEKKEHEKHYKHMKEEDKHEKHEKMCKVCGGLMNLLGEHKHTNDGDHHEKHEKHYKKVDTESTIKRNDLPEPRKMSDDQKDKRRKAMLSKAADKMFSRNYS